MSEAKEHILLTAFKLFLQKTFKEVTMKEIVDRTGLSKGAFYHYFNSKEGLFIEVVDKFLTPFMFLDYDKFSKESLFKFYSDYLVYIEKSFIEYKEIFMLTEREDVYINFYMLYFDALKIVPGFQNTMTKAMENELYAWEEVVEIAKKNGEIKSNMSNKEIANIFIFTNDGVGLRALFYGDINLMKKLLSQMWNNFYADMKV